MSDAVEKALFSLTGSVEAVRETMASIHFSDPSKILPVEPVDSDDVIALLKKNTDTYVEDLNKTNNLVSKLIRDLTECQLELAESRAYAKSLGEQLDLCSQTGTANVNRRTLNYYMQTIKHRNVTDQEWKLFITTFDYDNSDFDKKLYTWIETKLPASV